MAAPTPAPIYADNAPGNASLAPATFNGILTAAGGFVVSYLGSVLFQVTTAGVITLGAALARIVGGATSFSVRNNANTQDNLLVTDAGAVTVRNGLTVTAGGETVNGLLTANNGVTVNGSALTANAGATLSSATITGAATAGNLAVGSGATVTQIQVYTPTITPGSVTPSIGCFEYPYTVTGLRTSDKIFVNPPAPAANTTFVSARVSAADTLALTWYNQTAAGNVPASGTYTVLAIRS